MEDKAIRLLNLGVAVLLILAIFPQEYGYYVALRWIVSVASILSIYYVWTHDLMKTGLIYLFPLILFNPIIPFYMQKSSWVEFDVMFALYFGYQSLVIHESE